MLISLGFLVLIVLMSAGIAVIADNVGRKLGKKRVSFKCRAFSMRPKHVAQLGTAATGAAVSIITIVVVALVSKDVRDWIVQGRNAIAKAEAATQRAQNLENQIGERETKIRSQDSTIGAQKKEIEDKKREVEQGRNEVTRQKTEITKLTGSADKLRNEADRLRNDVTRARSNYEEANRKLATRQAQLSKVTVSLGQVKTQLANNKAMLTESMAQKNELSAENIRLLSKNGDLEKKQGELEAKQSSLQADITQLEDSRKKLEAAHQEALEALEQTRDDLVAAQNELAQAQGELRKKQQELNSALLSGMKLYDINNNARFAPLIFQVQEEVTRLQVDSGLSQASADAAMNKLLRSARLSALQRGARPNDRFPEAGIVERRDPVTGETVSGEELRRRIVREIVSSGQPLLIVASSSVNAFKGEPVSLDVVLYPNPMVYKVGQFIAESRVDGRKDDTEIYRQVAAFLGPKLRERTRQDRMIPKGIETVTPEVPFETVMKLVGDVKAAERPVRLIALAASDTRAGDDLKYAFQIR